MLTMSGVEWLLGAVPATLTADEAVVDIEVTGEGESDIG